MSIRVQCECGKKLKAKDEMAGRTSPCPDCGRMLTVPIPAPAPPAEEDEVIGLADEPARGYEDALDDPVAPPRPRRAPARAMATTAPASLGEGEGRSSPREFLYLILVLALVPLGSSIASPDRSDFGARLEAAVNHADAETKSRLEALEYREGVGLGDLLEAFPGGKVDDAAHLPHSTWVHWIYAAIAAAGFLGLALLMFPKEPKSPHHLLLAGLFTATVGIVLLLAFQLAAAATQGVWVRGRGRGIVLVLFYIVKFIGWSYASASAADSNFWLSFLGYTCGVGLCEELCKALPILSQFFGGNDRMGWRNAALWGLASGAGFGVAEGIMYSSRFYNGISPGEMYLVRFVSCAALHAIWTAAVGIVMWRRQDTLRQGEDGAGLALAVLQILAVPMVLHGLYDTLLKQDMDVYALGVGLASFAWLVLQVERARAGDDEKALARKPAWA
ncbi:PrsW family glutamic-type intramembrane protease [Aquisphaera insulae]|uniref:PrsW family glutamic-type intramembrane protease n=1 Tax=Aquisphaera insulae TaxID=2712864 RepID=UPI0013EACC2F|nr:PrsW family glutamic-type intramembrane protease [Aquisphaera insulae]